MDPLDRATRQLARDIYKERGRAGSRPAPRKGNLVSRLRLMDELRIIVPAVGRKL